MRLKQTIAILATLGLVASAHAQFEQNNSSTCFVDRVTGRFDSFNWKWAGYNTQSNDVYLYEGTTSTIFDCTGLNVGFKMSKQSGTAQTDYINTTNITISSNHLSWVVANTNIAPSATYDAELIVWSGATTNVTRSVAQGKITTFKSIYDEAGETFPFPGTPTGITAIIAGTNISVSPSTGIGDVTISATSVATTNTLAEVLSVGNDANGVAITNVEYLGMESLTSDPAHEAGRMFYNATDDTWAMYFSDPDITLNVGEELWIPARNNTTNTITNGQVVYVTGQIGKNPTIALAKADDFDTCRALAFATEDIAKNEIGKCTVYGSVGSLNTQGLTAGDRIYLSDTTAGAYTTNAPTSATSYIVNLGQVGIAGVNDGNINANITPAILASQVYGLTAYIDANALVTGAVQSTDSTYTDTVALASGALQKSGGTMTGDIDLNSNGLTDVGSITFTNAGSVAVDPDAGSVSIYDVGDDLVMVWSDSTRRLYGSTGAFTLDWSSRYLYFDWNCTNLYASGQITAYSLLNYNTSPTGFEAVNYDYLIGLGYLTDAPSNGTQYARQDGAWSEVAASGGGGTVTSLPARVYFNPTREFAIPDTFHVTTNNALNSRTVYAGSFPVASDVWSDMHWQSVESPWNGNFYFRCPFWNDGTTNLTTSWGLKLYDYNGSPLGTYTGSASTIIANCGITNRVLISEVVDLSSIVPTNSTLFGWSAGFFSTNTVVTDTRTGDNVSEFAEGSMIY